MDFENFILLRFLYQLYLHTDIINCLLSIIQNLMNTTPCFVCKNSQIHISKICYLEKYCDKKLIFDDHYSFNKYGNLPFFRPTLYPDNIDDYGEIFLICKKIYGTWYSNKNVEIILNYSTRVCVFRKSYSIVSYTENCQRIIINKVEIKCNNNIYCIDFDNLYIKR